MKNLFEYFGQSEDFAIVNKVVGEHAWATIGSNVNMDVWDGVRDGMSELVRNSVGRDVYLNIKRNIRARQL